MTPCRRLLLPRSHHLKKNKIVAKSLFWLQERWDLEIQSEWEGGCLGRSRVFSFNIWDSQQVRSPNTFCERWKIGERTVIWKNVYTQSRGSTSRSIGETETRKVQRRGLKNLKVCLHQNPVVPSKWSYETTKRPGRNGIRTSWETVRSRWLFMRKQKDVNIGPTRNTFF